VFFRSFHEFVCPWCVVRIAREDLIQIVGEAWVPTLGIGLAHGVSLYCTVTDSEVKRDRTVKNGIHTHCCVDTSIRLSR